MLVTRYSELSDGPLDGGMVRSDVATVSSASPSAQQFNCVGRNASLGCRCGRPDSEAVCVEGPGWVSGLTKHRTQVLEAAEPREWVSTGEGE